MWVGASSMCNSLHWAPCKSWLMKSAARRSENPPSRVFAASWMRDSATWVFQKVLSDHVCISEQERWIASVLLFCNICSNLFRPYYNLLYWLPSRKLTDLLLIYLSQCCQRLCGYTHFVFTCLHHFPSSSECGRISRSMRACSPTKSSSSSITKKNTN